MKPASNLGISSGLSNEIDTDGDSDVFNSDGNILPQFSAQDDAIVDADQFEPTLTDYVYEYENESEADKDRQAIDHTSIAMPIVKRHI